MKTPLFHLVYVSSPAETFTPADLKDLAYEAQMHNKTADLTGVLLYRKERFMQILEGPKESVKPLFEKIKQDPRHYHIDVLRESVISTRQFADWEMRYTLKQG